MKKEVSRAVSFDFIGGKDVMPITGFFGAFPTEYSKNGHIMPEYISDEIFAMIAEAGVNLIVYSMTDYKRSPEAVKKYLELGKKYGIGVFVNDSNVLDKAGEGEISPAELSKQIANYSDYDAFCGMYVVDEPRAPYYLPGDGTKYVSKFVELSRILQYELDYICYLNMFPVWDLKNNQENYLKYVEEFCETLKPRVLMWDKYPFSTGDDLSVYFYIMNLMKEKSEKYGVPFWAYVQTGAQWNEENIRFDSQLPYYPNEAQFQWNVNTSLVFGAQGIQYFPLIQPEHFAKAKSTEWDSKRNGIIGIFGEKNQWHRYAQNIGRQIRAIDEVLMNSVHKGIIVTGEQAKRDMRLTNCVFEAGTFEELMSVTGDVMVGCFNYNGKTALYVVNYSMEQEQDITLCFDKECNIKIVQNAENALVTVNKIQLHMTAGEGVLVVVES